MAADGSMMGQEMREQADVVRGLLERPLEVPDAGARTDGFAGILLIARGSSDNAAIYGRYVLELATGRPVVLAAPSLVTRYGATTDVRGWLAVAVSQSGATPEIIEVLRAAGAGGAATLALTNATDSPLAEAADATLWLGAGSERAVPATKTVTAQLAAFALLAERLGQPPWGHDDWSATIDAMRTVTADDAAPRTAVDRLLAAGAIVCLARGLVFPVALESALKVAETTARSAVGMSTADFLHGPVEAVDAHTCALCVLAPGPCARDVREVADDLHERGVRVVSVLPEDLDAPPGTVLPVPAGVPEGLLPLVSVIRGQQLALDMALALGRDPDNPPGLTKVTPTD